MTTQNRRSKFERVAARRQEMTVVLENVHDPHNIGAVLRSCDAVGIDEIFVLYTEDHLDFERLEKIGTSATGVKKWMKINCFRRAAVIDGLSDEFTWSSLRSRSRETSASRENSFTVH